MFTLGLSLIEFISMIESVRNYRFKNMFFFKYSSLTGVNGERLPSKNSGFNDTLEYCLRVSNSARPWNSAIQQKLHVIAHVGKNRNTKTYRGCSGLGKQEFVHMSLKDLEIVWWGKTDSGREFQSLDTFGTKDLEK